MLKSLSNPDLLTATQSAASREKQATYVLLEHLLEIDARDLALREGYSSLWDYVHRGLGYSEAAASERVAAMRLLKRSPEAAQLIKAEKLSLTVAAKVQHFVRAVEKTESRKVSEQETAKIIADCVGRSKREVEQMFVTQAPTAMTVRETMKPVAENVTELRIGMDAEFLKLLKEAKELCGAANNAETLKRGLKKLVADRKRELKGTRKASTRPAALGKYIPREMVRQIWARALNQCEFRSTTGMRCPSKHKLQVDHVLPRAKGGLTERENLRLLCQAHNLSEAREWGLTPPSESTPP